MTQSIHSQTSPVVAVVRQRPAQIQTDPRNTVRLLKALENLMPDFANLNFRKSGAIATLTMTAS